MCYQVMISVCRRSPCIIPSGKSINTPWVVGDKTTQGSQVSITCHRLLRNFPYLGLDPITSFMIASSVP